MRERRGRSGRLEKEGGEGNCVLLRNSSLAGKRRRKGQWRGRGAGRPPRKSGCRVVALLVSRKESGKEDGIKAFFFDEIQKYRSKKSLGKLINSFEKSTAPVNKVSLSLGIAMKY